MAKTASRTPKQTGPAEHNLPLPLSSLVGRSHELAAIEDKLRTARLVTLTGPGGVGKTRLALELAHRRLARRAGGVWLVDLASGGEAPDVAAETARLLGVPVRGGATPADALCGYVGDRDLLLVLDNCEQAVYACAKLAGALLRSCPGVRILTTSREVLGLEGETVWRLTPLTAEDARRLFVERARQRQPDFISEPHVDAALATLCAKLDHLPLAIEIAAARVEVLSPAEILAALEARLELGRHAPLSPIHHRSVRAAVDWSYHLLSAEERRAFRSLAVFVGGFDLDAARAVGVSLELVSRLVDKSLVAAIRSPRGRTRYRLLETVHAFAQERLVEAEELDSARQRHFDHFSGLVGTGPEGWPSTDAERLVTELEEDYENVRAAVEWSAAADACSAARLVAAAKDLFFMLGQADGRRLAELVLERCPNRDRRRAEVQILAGLLAMQVGDHESAKRTLVQAHGACVELGEQGLEAWVLFIHGLTETLEGELEGGRERLEASRALNMSCGDRIGEARATAALGLNLLAANDPGRARRLVEDALAIAAEERDDFGQGQCHLYLGIFEGSSTAARPELATGHYRRAATLLQRYRDATLLPVALAGQAAVLARREPARALRVAAAAASIRGRVGGEYPPLYREVAERARATAEPTLGADAARIWAEGARLAVDDAVALAFGGRRPRRQAATGLSERELTVSSLVAEGLSNKLIAARLHLSTRTVESHVRHALDKLALDNRTQLATWARDRTP